MRTGAVRTSGAERPLQPLRFRRPGGRRDVVLAGQTCQCRVGHPERVANFRQRRARLAQQRATVIFGPSGIYGVDDAALRPMTFED